MDDRCFLSLKFSPEQQRLLYAYQQPAFCQEAKWHPADNLHLTLVFLGQQALAAQQQLWLQSLELLHQLPTFELCFDELNQFSHAKVLYLGVSQPPETLMALQQQLQQLALPFLNAPVPEHFVPHVTLARKFQSAAVFPMPVQPLHLFCTEVALYHSISTKHGVSYQPVHTYTLVPKA
ncbi:2''-5'' RNA ligase [Rheinheimera sp. A13L]|uniref:RNA 2',3'-cyclic phosphodiesterase n=1 Tax=Rheinheimera sp. A13L TaxID=506534 RepID=UPI0002124958|nr:RNA 2',3'-cyclic phosphodiesterase [Rheinheimera sp. A13L]EGM76221.1 2''-5'' RNA ligase [Rheinheimera sp. A13L]